MPLLLSYVEGRNLEKIYLILLDHMVAFPSLQFKVYSVYSGTLAAYTAQIVIHY